MLTTPARPIEPPAVAASPETARRESLDVVSRRVVADLHTPSAAIYWADLGASAVIGWTAFAVAVASRLWSPAMIVAIVVSGFALYRGMCFTHEITHLRRRAVPGFETVWNLLLGVPLLLPSFTYAGVHQMHHHQATYGTKADPEYLPFANSRKLVLIFAAQSSLLLPVLLAVRFLVLAPLGLVSARFHRWLETYASSFSMNPHYRREISPAAARVMRRWEAGMLALYLAAAVAMSAGALPWRFALVWYLVMAFVCFFNTLRVLGAHEYETDGQPRDRYEQLADSIDTPGGVWTALWAPVGLRYHALHHFYPGIPYHNLGEAYHRIMKALPGNSLYAESTSPSLRASLLALYQKAKARGGKLIGW